MKEKHYPFEIAQSIAADTEKYMTTNIGCLRLLEQFDELPLEYRGQLLQMLSAFHRPQIGRFYQMIRDEYGAEYQSEVERALKKLRMAGVDVDEKPWVQGEFHAAFCTPTRHMGALSISIFWKVRSGEYMAECFLLDFSSEGIGNFALVEQISESDMQREADMLRSLTRMTLRESQLILTMSCDRNRKMLVRPSLGYFLYGRHVLEEKAFTLEEVRAVIQKVSAFLYGERLVNSLFLALKNDDLEYAFSLFHWGKLSPQKVLEIFAPLRNPGALFLEGRAETCERSAQIVWVNGYVLLYAGQQVEKYPCGFQMSFYPAEARWLIEKVELLPAEEPRFDANGNPLQQPLYVRVYEIMDMEALLNELDTLEQVQKVGELPYGMHLRICTVDDSFFDNGVSIMSGVVADLVVNGDEFVVLADQESILQEFDGKFADCIRFRQACSVSLNAALHYYQGQYLHFQDVLDEPEDYLPQDPMQFVTACYTILDQERFADFIHQQKVLHFAMPDGRNLYYQLTEAEPLQVFEAEYILDESYLTVSAFGQAQLEAIRKGIEQTLQGVLNFEHLEVNPHGFFEILTPDVKGMLPQLESFMKKLYLDKWYVSPSPFLEGMTPQAARMTEHGRRLLWQMFKFMRKRPSRFTAGKYADIAIQEYLNYLEQEKP